MSVLDDASLAADGMSSLGPAGVTAMLSRQADEVAAVVEGLARRTKTSLDTASVRSASRRSVLDEVGADTDHITPGTGRTEPVSTDMVPVADLFAELFGPGPAGDWQQLALCAEADPELFYPEARETAPEAKSICLVCEVRTECLAAALAAREPHGIWGGLTYRERLALGRDLRRAGRTGRAGHTVRRRRRS